MTPLRICVDGRLESGKFGGVEQVVIGLADGLSNLTDGDEEYFFLVQPGHEDWLRPHIRNACRLLQTRPSEQSGLRKIGLELKSEAKRRMPVLQKVWRELPAALLPAAKPAASDGTIEAACIDIMHFTMQGAFTTGLPSIYHPHDLQHLHLPQFFTQRDWQWRETMYKAFCEQASLVAVASTWVKQDLIEHYGLSDDKVEVVPLASLLNSDEEPSEPEILAMQGRLGIAEPFIFYAAQTWPHKNHIMLLRAIAQLRDEEKLKVNLVCSGTQTSFFPEIQRWIRELRLDDQVKFIGFVSPLDLRCLYHSCRAVVIPTKFEAASFPLYEAFSSGSPAACSNVTSLPEQAGDAALLFDPDHPEEIATALAHLWTDDALRLDLAERGKRRVQTLTWDRTARVFRAHYRRLAGRPLTADDRCLLEEPQPL